jgi:hypothetical protein
MNIRNPEDSSIRMADLCPEVEWSGFQMAKTRWGTYENGYLIVLAIRKPDQLVRFSNGRRIERFIIEMGHEKKILYNKTV